MEGDNPQQPEPDPSTLEKNYFWIIVTVIILSAVILSGFFILRTEPKYDLEVRVRSSWHRGTVSIFIDDEEKITRWIYEGGEITGRFILSPGKYTIRVSGESLEEVQTVSLYSDEIIFFYI